MRKDAYHLIENYNKKIHIIHKQRHQWLWASSIVFVSVILLIFLWDWVDSFQSKSIWWVIVSIMLIISINWWYWTMKTIKAVILYQNVEYALIKNILTDIEQLKSELKSFKK